MKKHRPFGITILAVLIGLGALLAVYHTLQFLHILPFSFGPIHFFAFDLLGALLWGINAAILIWVVSSLWNLRMEGRLFVMVIAVINLVLALASIIGQSSLSAMLPAILVNAIILIYCLTPGVEKAFAQANRPSLAVAAPAAAMPRGAVAPGMPVEKKVAPMAQQAVVAAPPVAEALVPPPVEAPVVPEAASVAVLAAEPVAVNALELPVEPEAVAVPELPVEPDAAAVPQPPVEYKAVEDISPARPSRRNVPIETIEGIGPTYGAKLKALSIECVADLLEAGASRKGREILAEKTRISSALILKWVNMADLMRISGIGEEFSELLEAAGVDTVKELRNRNPNNLYQALTEASKQHKMVRRTPHLSEVESWVEQAKQLEPLMTY